MQPISDKYVKIKNFISYKKHVLFIYKDSKLGIMK